MTTPDASPLDVSDITTVNGPTVKVYCLGGFKDVYGECTCFLAEKLLMVIGGPVHKSATITTLFRKHESDGIFRFVGSLDLGVKDELVTASLCGDFEHIGWVDGEARGSSKEFGVPSRDIFLSSHFRFKK